MSEKNINTNIHNSYNLYNRIRTKLLLFIDNEIRSKIKQNNNLKFNGNGEIKISFEETFIQNQDNKCNFPSSNILKVKKKDILDKTLSTIVTPNKIIKNRYQKEIGDVYSKTINKKGNCLNNIICFKKKIYSIKNLSKQSSTFLILPKQKSAAEYLKNLCNNLKKHKKNKKFLLRNKRISINTKFKDKKIIKNSNEKNILKSNNDKLYSFSLFKKSQKKNFVTNSKHQISKKSAYSILITN